MGNRRLAALCAASVLLVLVSAEPAAAGDGSCLGKKATIVGTNGDDTLRGTHGDDVIVAAGGDDHIDGVGGYDRICGGPGADEIDGGKGIDRLHGGRGHDTIRGGCGDCYDPGADWQRIYGGSGNDRLFGSDERDTILGGPGHDFIAGRGSDYGELEGPDLLSGEAGNDRIVAGNRDAYDDIAGSEASGGPGNDHMSGLDGLWAEILSGGPGDDTYVGAEICCTRISFEDATTPVVVDLTQGTATGEGNDVLRQVGEVIGSEHDDTLIGDAGPNFIRGEGGNDTVRAGDGDDVVLGGTGDDTLDGGVGSDTVSFWRSGTPVVVDLATDSSTGEGADTLTDFENVEGSRYADHIAGDDGANVLFGGDGFDLGPDVIEGRGGADEIYGTGGNDILDGGDDGATEAHDLTDGGSGNDTCTRAEERVSCET